MRWSPALFPEADRFAMSISSLAESGRSLAADPLQDADLSGFARRFREGAQTAESATRAYLQRIAVLEPHIGAFRKIDESAALRRARQIDALHEGGHDLGPLMGVPVAVKELFRVEGFAFGAGTDLDIDDLVPPQGPFVTALQRAGCIVLGVTRTTEFAASTINSSKPMPWNPWDARIKRVCGGSSHGSAAALGAGMCAFAVGSDTGGSVRLPAALCGSVGFKPSVGVWSTEGVFPLAPTFDTVGIFARSVGDARLIFTTLTGRALAPEPLPSELHLARAANLFDDLDPPVAEGVERAMAKLAEAGVRFSNIELPETSEVASVFGRILAAELIRYIGRERLIANRERIDPVPWSRIESELGMDEATLDTLRGRHRELSKSIRQRTREFDAVICPTTPVTPCPASDVDEAGAAIAWNRRSGRNTRPGNLFGQCGISLPVQAAGALPVGLQLLCSEGEDDRLLAIASSLEGVVCLGTAPDLTSFLQPVLKEQT
jgi:aspartyl-tRNA(Asn)/glutamyl-tRNA(Gln) amidotransferase subunit A